MKRLFMTAIFSGIMTGVSLAANEDLVFDFQALVSTPLNARILKPPVEKDGIVTEEVIFHSEMDGEKSVDIFAFFSYPKGGEKLPAFIWNQGGLYQATTWFTELGAKRGYAALCIDFPIPKYRSTGDYPINAGLELGDDPKKAPIYHGAVALLKAVSYLESRKEVDKNRIGMAGSSWGGFYTTLMIGVDPRLKAGSCMFGTGNLQLGNNWWDGSGYDTKRDAAFRERWRTTLDPAFRLPKRKTPIAWFTGSNDFAYWMPALMETCAMPGGKKHLTLLPNWDHGLTEILDEQVFAWLDAHLKGAPPFVEVTPLEVIKKDKSLLAHWLFSGPREVKSADLILSYGDAGNWNARYWITLKAEIEGGKCVVKLPPAAMPYYIGGSVTDKDGFRYSTPLVRVDPTALGVADPDAFPDYNGCSEWGGFEEAQVIYLQGEGFMNPTVSHDAKEGKQSAVLKGQVGVGRAIYFTTDIPHRFTAFLKADQAADVVVQLSGEFDGKSKIEEKTFKIGKDWTPISMDYLPPKALSAKLSVVFKAPEGVTVLLDSIAFRPVKRTGSE